MNKADLIKEIASDAGITQAAAGRALDSVVKSITNVVASGDSVTLVGFGTFKAKSAPARTCKNPSTGAEIQVPAKTLPKFVAGKTFKDKVNG